MNGKKHTTEDKITDMKLDFAGDRAGRRSGIKEVPTL